MATINFDNKEAISQYPSIPEKNKVTDANINLIKQVGNQILTTLGVYTDDWDDTATYLIDDVVVYDNRYFKNLTGTNTSTPPTEDSTNWVEVSLREISGGAEIPIQNTAPANPREDDLWIDTSEEGFDNSNVVNQYSESTSDVYSCGYSNKANTYSTTETIIGKWVDGKTLYRKVIDTGALPNSTTKVIGTINTDERITNIYGCTFNSNNNFTMPIPTISTASLTECIQIYVDGSYNITIRTGSNRNGYSGYVVVEYTKGNS